MSTKFDIEQYVRNKVVPKQVKHLRKEEKVKWIKDRFGLSHGGTKQNKKKRRKK